MNSGELGDLGGGDAPRPSGDPLSHKRALRHGRNSQCVLCM